MASARGDLLLSIRTVVTNLSLSLRRFLLAGWLVVRNSLSFSLEIPSVQPDGSQTLSIQISLKLSDLKPKSHSLQSLSPPRYACYKLKFQKLQLQWSKITSAVSRLCKKKAYKLTTLTTAPGQVYYLAQGSVSVVNPPRPSSSHTFFWHVKVLVCLTLTWGHFRACVQQVYSQDTYQTPFVIAMPIPNIFTCRKQSSKSVLRGPFLKASPSSPTPLSWQLLQP